ncbi:hypothetical protein N1851_007714 [Merluccius polli]|uniref:Uncharacterized protein n=1 Tax=Merluccius polli TaxID=89951 RepID=A0AA47N3N9_MERPO|nr:hypothetical protein N1851_007714 [Merluccius polli]
MIANKLIEVAESPPQRTYWHHLPKPARLVDLTPLRPDALSQAMVYSPLTQSVGATAVLASERLILQGKCLPVAVISMIQCARTSSTSSLYTAKWGAFDHAIPSRCEVGSVLGFLQSLLEKGLAFSTVKVYAAAVLAGQRFLTRFLPKNIGSSFQGGHCAKGYPPPPHSNESEVDLFCLVRALAMYMQHLATFRSTQQLFVCYSNAAKGCTHSKQRLHSARLGTTASMALLKGVAVEDICTATSWSSPILFVRFYMLDMTKGSFSHSVLEAGAPDSSRVEDKLLLRADTILNIVSA